MTIDNSPTFDSRHLYSGILLSHKEESLLSANYMDLEVIMLSETIQKKINTI